MTKPIVFTGPREVQLYRAMVLKSGLLMYAQHRIKPNSAWTPTNMLRTAGGITGKVYKRGEYYLAAQDLAAWISREPND